MSRAFEIIVRCPASPNGWAEVADDCPGDLDFVRTLTAAELLAHPYGGHWPRTSQRDAKPDKPHPWRMMNERE